MFRFGETARWEHRIHSAAPHSTNDVPYSDAIMKSTVSATFRCLWLLCFWATLSVSNASGQGITDDDHIARIKGNSLFLQTGLGLAVVNPQSHFREALQAVGGPNVGFGINVHLGYRLTHTPIWLVATFAPTFIGGTYDIVPFDGGVFSSREITSQTTVMPFSVGLRIQPDIANTFYPYAEALGGFTTLTSTATYRETRLNRSSERRETRLDATWNYGIGAGMAVNVADMVSLPNSLQRFTIDATMRYLRGGALDVVRGVVDATSTDFVWQRSASSDFVLFSLGLTVQF
jgi:hypothetical protein